MSKIVEQTENGYIIQLNSGREKEFYIEDFLYPDPRVGDKVVVYRDKDGYPVVDLKEYYNADHQKTTAKNSDKVTKHVPKGKGNKSVKSGSASGFMQLVSENKFGVISIILAIMGIPFWPFSLAGIVLGIIGAIKDRKRWVPVVGILLSCFVFAVSMSEPSSNSSDSSTAAASEFAAGDTSTIDTTKASDSENSEVHKDGWIIPEYGETKLFGNMTYPTITNWPDATNDGGDNVGFYPYGKSSTQGVFFIVKEIAKDGDSDSAYNSALQSFVGSSYTITWHDIATKYGLKYLGAAVESSDGTTMCLIEHIDSSYVYFFCGMESGDLSTDMMNFLGEFIGKVSYTVDGPVQVYSDDKVDISYKGTTEDGVYFNVNNKTNANVTIQADSLSVNGQSVNDIMLSSDVAPQSTGTILAGCSVSETNAVTTVSGQLRVIDFNDSFESYDASFVNVKVVNAEGISTGTASEEKIYTLLYQDDRVKIYFDSVERTGINFRIENMSDVDITFQVDSVSINGTSYNDLGMSDDVAPKSTGVVKARGNITVPDKVNTVSGQLRVIDFNDSFESYAANFSDIAIQ